MTSSRNVDQAVLGALAAAWLDTHLSPNTRAAYCSDFRVFGRWCTDNGAVPLRVDAATLAAFQTARQAAGDSSSTLRRRWSALSSFYEYATDNGATATNPALGAQRPGIVAGDASPTAQLSRRSVNRYRALAAQLDPRLDALVSLLVVDGLKIGEALALDVEDITGRPPRTKIVIRRRGVPTRVKLDADSSRAVIRCAGLRHSGPVFISGRTSSEPEPRRLTRFGADHLIRQLTTDNQDRVTANALRRFHISANHQAGTDLDSVRERAGLADVRSVRRYLPTRAR
jgi:integrase